MAGGGFLGPGDWSSALGEIVHQPWRAEPSTQGSSLGAGPRCRHHRNQQPPQESREQKGGPEMMGPSPGGLGTWARSSTLRHPTACTWGHSCLQSPGLLGEVGEGLPIRRQLLARPFPGRPGPCPPAEGDTHQVKGCASSARLSLPQSPKSLGTACLAPPRVRSLQGPKPPRRVGETHPSVTGQGKGAQPLPGPVPNSTPPPTQLPSTLSRGRPGQAAGGRRGAARRTAPGQGWIRPLPRPS